MNEYFYCQITSQVHAFHWKLLAKTIRNAATFSQIHFTCSCCCLFTCQLQIRTSLHQEQCWRIRILKCGSGSGSGSYPKWRIRIRIRIQILPGPLDRARNSDHFTFLTFDNPSICSGARPFQSLALFAKTKKLSQKIELFDNFFADFLPFFIFFKSL